MFATCALELVKELDRQPNEIPPYNYELIEKALSEMERLELGIQKDASVLQNMSDSGDYSQQQLNDSKINVVPNVIARHAAMERNKRCVMSYLNERMKRIKEYRWNHGGIMTPDKRVNLSENELEYFHSYSTGLSLYMIELGDGIDMTLHQKPPTSLFIQVRCVFDYGDYAVNENRTVLLSINSIHSLPRANALSLIKKGIVQQV